MEIFLPWEGFNGVVSQYSTPAEAAYGVAERFHPAWDMLDPSSKKFHARNAHQVLGYDLSTPASFIVCWTPDGTAIGGTGQAIRIAHGYNIPVFNLKNEKDRQNLVLQVKSLVI